MDYGLGVGVGLAAEDRRTIRSATGVLSSVWVPATITKSPSLRLASASFDPSGFCIVEVDPAEKEIFVSDLASLMVTLLVDLVVILPRYTNLFGGVEVKSVNRLAIIEPSALGVPRTIVLSPTAASLNFTCFLSPEGERRMIIVLAETEATLSLCRVVEIVRRRPVDWMLMIVPTITGFWGWEEFWESRF